jgi:exopolyphosphatase/guanosine-5'-triphosphate,3'-diphosphate pyrophosphatase
VRRGAVESLARAFRGYDPRAARRRRELAAQLSGALDPRAAEEVRESLLHAATLLDIGSSIDFFDRHEHVADIVLSTDLLGFSHRRVALLSALLRAAGDGAADIEAYAPLLGRDDRRSVERAATLLVLADDIEERCSDGRPITLKARRLPRQVRLRVGGLGGWRPRRIGARFARVFGRELRVLAA